MKFNYEIRIEELEAENARLTRELDMAKRGNRRQWDENARLRTALEEISERRFRCADKNCYASDVAREAIGPAAPAEEVKE